MKQADFAKHLFGFPKYLEEEGFSKNTRESYCDAIVKLILFMEKVKGVGRADLSLKDLKKDIVIEFLDWIIKNEKCAINTRNYRLAAIKKFFEYSSEEDPFYTYEYQKIRDIKKKRTHNAERRAMSEEEMALLLKEPDTTTLIGRRDYVLITLMYYTAARVQEIANLTPTSLRLNGSPVVELFGKGGKSRIVEIPPDVADMLRNYLKENDFEEKNAQNKFLFSGPKGKMLTRQSIYLRIKKYLRKANEKNPEFDILGLSCHTLRHSRATHWSERQMPPVLISYLLGHADETTTMIYTKISMKARQQAFEKIQNDESTREAPLWVPGFDLISRLRRLSSA
jgi:integrase/recombinase XerD